MTWRIGSVLCILLLVAFSRGLTEDLRDPAHRVDYVIIAPACYIGHAEELASFRRMHGGYSTIVVSLDTILAQFKGSPSTDSCMKEFITYALEHWQSPKPGYFVLMGNVNVLPSHKEPEMVLPPDFADSDSVCVDHWFVESAPGPGGYGGAGAVVGRLPAWDPVALSVMIGKIGAYEVSEPEGWWSRCIGLADYSVEDGLVFEWELQSMQEVLAKIWPDTIAAHMNADSPRHMDSIAFRRTWDRGASIVLYEGHANPYTLSASRYFTTNSVDSLKNEGRLPVFLSLGCSMRYEVRNPLSSISVHLLDQPGGGAVACIVSSGLMWMASGTTFLSSMSKEWKSEPSATLGEVFRAAKDRNAEWVVRRYTLLGDPALRVKRPGGVTGVTASREVPAGFSLEQNFPNPFNPNSDIRYLISEFRTVRLAVYDLLGREVAMLVNEAKQPGTYTVRFDASGLASGVYLYRLTAGSFVETKKMVVVR
jgi:hypothetical protein